MPFSLLFSVDSRLHTLFAHCSTVSARIIRADYPRPLRGLPAAIMRILRSRYADYLCRSARNNHGSLWKKLSFPCHVPYLSLLVVHPFLFLFCIHCGDYKPADSQTGPGYFFAHRHKALSLQNYPKSEAFLSFS